jgi:hypothetical protein
MATSKTQIRGICQICGNQQAVRSNGGIAHHGYTMEYGFFNGSCIGSGSKPLNISNADLLKNIEAIKVMIKTTSDIVKNQTTPEMVCVSSYKNEWKKLSEVAEHQQDRYVRSYFETQERRIKDMKRYIVNMTKLSEEVLGTPLVSVTLESKPTPRQPQKGEVVKCETGLLTAITIKYDSVDWVREDGKKGNTSIRRWRNFQLIVNQ